MFAEENLEAQSQTHNELLAGDDVIGGRLTPIGSLPSLSPFFSGPSHPSRTVEQCLVRQFLSSDASTQVAVGVLG